MVPPDDRSLLQRFLGIADEADDDDDVHLRKRVGVAAGYLNAFLPLVLPIVSQGHPLSWFVLATMPAVNALNLAVLYRTRRFERYVNVLILSSMLLPVVVEIGLGGLGGSSAGFLFAFLGPVYAVLALGPKKATRWFVFFIVLLVGLVLIDPIVSSRIAPQPYEMRLVFYVVNLAIPLGLAFAMLRYTDVRRREEKARADELFNNAIPKPIAVRLRRGERRIAEAYPGTTVLFADLVDFTQWTRRTDPEVVVSYLDNLFTRFDELAAANNVEKIKTIGDAYMAVAGAPEPLATHPHAALALAIRMLESASTIAPADGEPFELRLGLASGPTVGGVIGRQRILFDIWGDTVNTASRMQSFGVPGRIQVAASTRALLADECLFEDHGPLEIKGLGLETGFLFVAYRDAG